MRLRSLRTSAFTHNHISAQLLLVAANNGVPEEEGSSEFEKGQTKCGGW